jgi:hypothetical protein
LVTDAALRDGRRPARERLSQRGCASEAAEAGNVDDAVLGVKGEQVFGPAVILGLRERRKQRPDLLCYLREGDGRGRHLIACGVSGRPRPPMTLMPTRRQWNSLTCPPRRWDRTLLER